MAFLNFEGSLGSVMREALTLTIRPEKVRRAASERVDILEEARARAPSAELITGNVNYSITVSVDHTEIEDLKLGIAEICLVSPRRFIEHFGTATRVDGDE